MPYVKIERAIAVVIEPYCAGEKAWLAKMGLCGYVGEGAVVIVVIPRMIRP